MLLQQHPVLWKMSDANSRGSRKAYKCSCARCQNRRQHHNHTITPRPFVHMCAGAAADDDMMTIISTAEEVAGDEQ